MRARRIVTLAAATVLAGAGSIAVLAGPADANDVSFRARLKDPSGETVGRVTFRIHRHTMDVDARMYPNDNVTPNQFHGFHVHKSTTAAVTPCEADPDAAQKDWFLSAGPHLFEGTQTHGGHEGDMPSPLVLSDGTAELSFTTDRIDPADLAGTAVILHDKPDNFGNVPADQYNPAVPTAKETTSNTGNAGNRVACGQVKRSWWH